MPNGLIIRMGDKSITLKGANSSALIGGHGMTEVDKELFDAWLARNKDYEPVKQGLIFAHEKEVNTKAEATEKKHTKSGAEGLNPDKPAPGLEKAEVK